MNNPFQNLKNLIQEIVHNGQAQVYQQPYGGYEAEAAQGHHSQPHHHQQQYSHQFPQQGGHRGGGHHRRVSRNGAVHIRVGQPQQQHHLPEQNSRQLVYGRGGGGHLQQGPQRQQHRHQQPQGHHHQQRGRQGNNSREGGLMQNEINEALEAHNRARQEAPGPQRAPLEWSRTLAQDAQKWAEKLASEGKFEHTPEHLRNSQGENLYYRSGSSFSSSSRSSSSLTDATNAWVGEKKYYHGQTVGSGGDDKWGHYTQIIWPETTSVGMGRAKGRDGREVVVARYLPAGNMWGRSAWQG